MILNPPQTKGLPVHSSTVYSAAQPRPLTPVTPCGDPVSVGYFATVAVAHCLLWKTVKICINNFIEVTNKGCIDHKALQRIEEKLSSRSNYPESSLGNNGN